MAIDKNILKIYDKALNGIHASDRSRRKKWECDERHTEGRVHAVDVGKSMFHVVLWIPLLIVPFAGWMWAMVVRHLLVRKAETGIDAGEECSCDGIHRGRFEGRAGTYKREGTKA
jgi:hypothetical protein